MTHRPKSGWAPVFIIETPPYPFIYVLAMAVSIPKCRTELIQRLYYA